MGKPRITLTKHNICQFYDELPLSRMSRLNAIVCSMDEIEQVALCEDKVHPFYEVKGTRTPTRGHFRCKKWSCLGCGAMNIAPYLKYLLDHYYDDLDSLVYRIEVGAKYNKSVREKQSRLHVPRFVFPLKTGGLMAIMKYPVAFDRIANVESVPMTVEDAIRFLVQYDHASIARSFQNKPFVNSGGTRVKTEREGWYLPRKLEQLPECKEEKSHYIQNTSEEFIEYLEKHGIFIGRPRPAEVSDDEFTRIIESYVPASKFKITQPQPQPLLRLAL